MAASRWIGLVDQLLRVAISPELWRRGDEELRTAKGVVASCVALSFAAALTASVRWVVGIPGALEAACAVIGFAGIYGVMRWTGQPRLAAHALFALVIALHLSVSLRTGGVLVVSTMAPIIVVTVAVLVLGRRQAGIWAAILIAEAICLVVLWHLHPSETPSLNLDRARVGWFLAMPTSIIVLYTVAFVLDNLREFSQRQLKQSERDRLRWAHEVGRREVGNRVLHHVGNYVNAAMIEMQLVCQDRSCDLEQSLNRIRQSIEDRGGPDSAMERLLVALANQARVEAEQRRASAQRGVEGMEKVQKLLSRHPENEESFTESIALDELVSETIARAQVRHNDLSTQFLVELEVEQAQGDWFKLSRIIENLVDNALRHGLAGHARGPGKVRISSRAAQDKGQRMLHFEIVDNGSGIPASRRAQVFAAKAADGVLVDGWGLHECANAAHEIGGKLELLIRPDERWSGAHFRLSLPHPEVRETPAESLISTSGSRLSRVA